MLTILNAEGSQVEMSLRESIPKPRGKVLQNVIKYHNGVKAMLLEADRSKNRVADQKGIFLPRIFTMDEADEMSAWHLLMQEQWEIVRKMLNLP